MDKEKYFEISKKRDTDLRRTPTNGEGKTFRVQNMWQIHHEIARLHALGLKNTSIAEKLNVSNAMVNYTVNSPIVQAKVAILQGTRDAETVDLVDKIRDIGQKAVLVHETILNDEKASPALKLRSADSILDRIPETSKQRRVDSRHSHLHAHLSAEEIEDIKEKGKRAAIESGEMVVDVEAEVVDG